MGKLKRTVASLLHALSLTFNGEVHGFVSFMPENENCHCFAKLMLCADHRQGNNDAVKEVDSLRNDLERLQSCGRV